MKRNFLSISCAFGVLLVAFCGLTPSLVAQEAGGGRNPELELELRYIGELMRLRMPDYAELVLADAEKRFPDARGRFKVLRLEQQLQQGKFDEVKAIIAAEADQDSPETWAMKLSMADYYYGFGRYPEALGVYQGFFKKYEGEPPAALLSFYMESAYKYAQMLQFLKRDKDALEAYRNLLESPLDRHVKRQVQFEAAELMVRIAEKSTDEKERGALLAEARKICEDILWVQDLWFGRGIVLMAHIDVIEGSVETAQKLIQTYMPQLRAIDDQLKEQAKEGGEDLSRLSPVAECRYLMGVMLHDEASKLLGADSPSREDLNKARDLLVGKRSGDKGGSSNGAYQELLNVFVRFPDTSWAPDAANRVEEIERLLLEHELVRSIKANISEEQKLEVARRQFQNARMLYNQQQFENAIEAYVNVLRQFPETVPESVVALSELARCYIELFDPNDTETRINELYADMVVGYLAERFCKQPRAMSLAGDELRRIADLYGERKQEEKRRATYDAFFANYPEHPMAAPMLMSFSERYYQAQDYGQALQGYEQLANIYTNSPFSFDALNRMSVIYRSQGDITNEIATLETYLDRLEKRRRPGQEFVTAQFMMAQAIRTQGTALLRSEDKAEVTKGNERIAQAINAYGRIITMLQGEDLGLYEANADETRRNQSIREAALFGRAYCIAVLTEPADKLDDWKRQAIATYEEMLKQYPESEYAPAALNQIGTLWITLKDNEKADEALSRLNKQYPDSNEARMALYTRGKALIELGYRNEGVQVLKRMFENASQYPANQMLTVGQEMLKSREYELAMQGFDFAVANAKDNAAVLMPATLGRAEVLIASKRFEEAVKELDAFLGKYKRSTLTIDANLNLSLAASELAITLDDREERIKMFNRSVDAMRVVRTFRTEPGELAQTDNDIGRILLRKAEAEKRLNEPQREIEYINQAIAHFITVIDSADSSVPEVSPHLEESFRITIPLMLKVNEPADAKEYAERYLAIYPNGRFATDARNWLNEATISLSTTR